MLEKANRARRVLAYRGKSQKVEHAVHDLQRVIHLNYENLVMSFTKVCITKRLQLPKRAAFKQIY